MSGRMWWPLMSEMLLIDGALGIGYVRGWGMI